MPNRNPRASLRLRQQIAAEAARILATEGQRNYRLAKEKAAARLGASSRTALPSNTEVEAELRRYQALYGGTDQTRHLSELREAAARAMQFLARFRPRLCGPVLEGTADLHSRIQLQVFCEQPEEVLLFLHERGIAFDEERRRIRWFDNSQRDLELLVFEAGDQVFELILRSGSAAREPLPDPVSGRRQRRAGLSEVRRLIDSDT
ncbi:MAG: hypothetical protein Kow0020_09830 [Wenzhouxiangellaceae bacterium]